MGITLRPRSVGIFVFFVIFVALQHLRSRGFPYQPAPFILCIKKLQSRKWMSGISLKPENFGYDSKFFAVFAEHVKRNSASDIGQVTRNVDQRALRSDVLCDAFSYVMFATGIIPFRSDKKGSQVTRT